MTLAPMQKNLLCEIEIVKGKTPSTCESKIVRNAFTIRESFGYQNILVIVK